MPAATINCNCQGQSIVYIPLTLAPISHLNIHHNIQA